MRPFIYLKNVTTLEVMAEKCISCGLCIEVCPHAVLYLNEMGRICVSNKNACMECGACSRNCPTEALFVRTGVGCVAAVINAMLGREGSCCCSNIESVDKGMGKGGSSCC